MFRMPIQGVSEKNGTVAIFPNIYNSRICPDGRKIVVTSGIEIAQNDRQVKKQNLFKLNKLTSLILPHHRASVTHVILTLQQMGFWVILFKQCLTSHAKRHSDMNGVNLKLRSIHIIWPTCICHIYRRVVNIGGNSNCSVFLIHPVYNIYYTSTYTCGGVMDRYQGCTHSMCPLRTLGPGEGGGGGGGTEGEGWRGGRVGCPCLKVKCWSSLMYSLGWRLDDGSGIAGWRTLATSIMPSPWSVRGSVPVSPDPAFLRPGGGGGDAGREGVPQNVEGLVFSQPPRVNLNSSCLLTRW